MEKVPKVFISYSWSSPEHEEKVISLSQRLMSHGVQVVIDKWDLQPGHDKYAFMEQAVVDPEMDRVLIICDEKYVSKANSRTGGVGDETMIISAEVYGKVQQEKFIAIIFQCDEKGIPFLPAYIKSRIYINLSDDRKYEEEYEKLLRNIHQRPLYKKPALGPIPEWISEDEIDFTLIREIIKQLRGPQNNSKRVDTLIRRFTDSFLEAMKDLLPASPPSYEQVAENIDKTKPLRDLYLEVLDALLMSDISIGEKLTGFFETIYNGLFGAQDGKVATSEADYDHLRFLIWEMFINTTAFLYHYERYDDIAALTRHTYFLRNQNRIEEACCFTHFRFMLSSIEEGLKPHTSDPNLFSLTAQILVGREMKPIITKQKIVSADVLLCQLSAIHCNANDDYGYFMWFPATYVYDRSSGNIWSKLISKNFCLKSLNLYGATSIEQLQENVKKFDFNGKDGFPMRYNRAFERAPSIASSIKIEDIGSRP